MKKKAFADIDNVAANCELHTTVVDFAKQVFIYLYIDNTDAACHMQ